MTRTAQSLFRMANAFLLLATLLPGPGSAAEQAAGDATGRPPNILLLIGDDMGNEAFSCYGLNGNPAKTPTLDELCDTGVHFSNFWSQPVCSPTRATMLTGRYGFRTGVGRPTGDRDAKGYFPDPPPKPETAPAEPSRGGPPHRADAPTDWGLPLNEFTLPMAFKVNRQLGYHTAAIGKWHLADRRNGWEQHPNIVGFDHFSGLIRGFPDSYFTWNKVVDGEWSGATGYAPDDKTNDAIEWLASQHDNPWFLWFAFNLAHTPLHKPPDELLLNDYSRVDPATVPSRMEGLTYFNMMLEAMDSEIRRILDSLPAAQRSNTFIIFLGDNGSGRPTVRPPFDPMRAKGTVYQGGVNVPLIVTGPGVAAGGVSDALVNSTDIFSTILEMAGIDAGETVPENVVLDSISFMPYLKEPGAGSMRKWVYADYFEGSFAGIPDANYAMRNAEFKLLREDGNVEFYNLATDPYENDNLLERKLTLDEQANFDALSEQVRSLRTGYPYRGAKDET